MKRLLLFFLPALFVSACAISMYGTHPLLKQEESELITAHQVSMDKPVLKNKILMFITESYGSAKAVIQVNEDGMLSGNGISLINYDSPGIAGKVDTKMEYKFIIKYSDNEVKTKYVFARMFNEASDGRIYEFSPSEYGYYRERIMPAFKSIDSLMYNYITADNDF